MSNVFIIVCSDLIKIPNNFINVCSNLITTCHDLITALLTTIEYNLHAHLQTEAKTSLKIFVYN